MIKQNEDGDAQQFRVADVGNIGLPKYLPVIWMRDAQDEPNGNRNRKDDHCPQQHLEITLPFKQEEWRKECQRVEDDDVFEFFCRGQWGGRIEEAYRQSELQ